MASFFQIMRKRKACLLCMYAIRGDGDHVEFICAWDRWRRYASRRVRFRRYPCQCYRLRALAPPW